jgi:hypothetical protein
MNITIRTGDYIYPGNYGAQNIEPSRLIPENLKITPLKSEAGYALAILPANCVLDIQAVEDDLDQPYALIPENDPENPVSGQNAGAILDTAASRGLKIIADAGLLQRRHNLFRLNGGADLHALPVETVFARISKLRV